MMDRVTHKPRGFGFVTFEHEDYVDFLFDDHADPYHELDGKRVCGYPLPFRKTWMFGLH